MNKRIFGIICLLLAAFGAVFFTAKDYGLYSDTIGTVTEVKNFYEKTRASDDGTYRHKEKYYRQELTLKIRNGKYKGRILKAENHFARSEVYDIKYSKGDDLFIEQVKSGQEGFTGKITGVKRDYYVVLALVIMAVFFLLAAGKDGILTLISLVMNVVMFYFVLRLYLEGHNILFMTVPMVMFFAGLLLFFMYGFNERSILSFLAIIIAAAITALIFEIVLKFSGNIDYTFMDYLIQPHDETDADRIFLSEIIIGCLGAITDAAVTVVITVDQITVHNPGAGSRELLKSCRAVGDDIIGTMIGVMFFSNVASAIPFIILSMRNGIAFSVILRYNSFFEIARFLTGSIGIVLSIPIASFISIYRYTHRKKMKSC